MFGLKMLPQVSLSFVYENQGHLMDPTAILQWYVTLRLFLCHSNTANLFLLSLSLYFFANYFLQKLLVKQYLLVVLADRNRFIYKDIKRLTLSFSSDQADNFAFSHELLITFCFVSSLLLAPYLRATLYAYSVSLANCCLHFDTMNTLRLSFIMLVTSQITRDCKCLIHIN